MKEIDICYGEYASRWSLTDFYEDSKDTLIEALKSGEDFTTGWWGCKKEIRYANITRENGIITIEVSAHMDDLWEADDLIYDALWTALRIEEELPDDIIDSIRDAAIDCGIHDLTTITDSFPVSKSVIKLYNDIVESIDKLESSAECENEEMYKRLCTIVKEHYEYMKGA